MSRAEEEMILKYDSYKNGYNASSKSSGGFYNEEHLIKCQKVLDELNKKQKNENHPRTDFSKDEILEIFSYAMRGAPVKWVYNQYKHHNITYDSFKEIYRGNHFKDYLPADWDNRPVVSTNSTLWGEWVIDIKTRFLKGETIDDIYKIYKDRCSIEQLRNIKNNKTYKQIHPCID